MHAELPPTTDTPPEPVRVPEWSEAAQRPGESTEHYRWLRVYLGMAPADRHLGEVAELVARSYSQVRKTAARWQWRARSLAWDREQRHMQGAGLREVVTLGMTRTANAAHTHSRTLEHVAAHEGRDMPRDTATAIKTLSSSLKEIAAYAEELEATPPLRPEVSELAKTDLMAAWRAAMSDMLTSGSIRPGDLVGMGRMLLSDPGADDDTVDPAAFLRRVQLRLPEEHRTALETAVRDELGADSASG